MEELNVSAELHAGPEEVQAQLEHVLAAERFRKAPSLSHLLRYLVTAMVNGHSDHLKETVIGIEVFGRRADFDCRIDNIVRVQAHRLRKSLETYYTEEGSGDRIRFDIPKGSYIPQWRPVDESTAKPVETVAVPVPVAVPEIAPPPPFAIEPLVAIHSVPGAGLPQDSIPVPALPTKREETKPKGTTPKHTSRFAIAGAFLAGALCAGFLLFIPAAREAAEDLGGSSTGTATENLKEGALGDIWKPFLHPEVATIASFTNPTFLRSESGVYVNYTGPLSAPTGAIIDISPNDPSIDRELLRKIGSRFFFSDSWTGTGEVLAVHKLTRLFGNADFNVDVRRSRSITYEDLRRSNLIFIGSPWGNPILDKIRAVETPFACCDGGTLQNRSPRPGEPETYERTRDTGTGELSSVYGLFSVLPGIAPGRKIAISAGLSTHGTWSAVDYVTSAAGAAEISRRLREQMGGQMPDYFQLVIRTAIFNGEPSRTSLVTARPVNASASDKK